MSETRIDARGLRCPWPALRLARAMREAGEGATVRIVADDPAAPRELAALAQEQGWHLTRIDTSVPAEFIVEVPPPVVNRIFTPVG